MPSSSFTIASLTETLMILMNTPMILPSENEMQDEEVALTDLPQSSRRQQFVFSRMCADSTSTYSTTAFSTDASSRGSIEADVLPAAAILRAQEVTGQHAPSISRIPITPSSSYPVIAAPHATPALPTSTLSTLNTSTDMVEAAEYNDSHFYDTPLND